MLGGSEPPPYGIFALIDAEMHTFGCPAGTSVGLRITGSALSAANFPPPAVREGGNIIEPHKKPADFRGLL